jgi:F-type H+-transporting ATPase subunit gamma
MPNLQDIRRRISSVKNTQQITNAMKMVSAAKLQRAQDRVTAARPYSERMQLVVEHLEARVQTTRHALLQPRVEGKSLLLVVTSDRGLCGGFNGNIQRATAEKIRELGGGEQIDIIAVGKKGRDFLNYRQFALLDSYIEIFLREVTYEQARDIAQRLLSLYEQEAYRQVLVVSNRFRSAMVQEVAILQMLPMSTLADPDDEPDEPFDYLYEPSPMQVLDTLLRKQIEVQIFQILQESFAGEHGARMTAMDAATQNATEMIDSLTLTFNRARQAAITTELIEVVSGAAALQ